MSSPIAAASATTAPAQSSQVGAIPTEPIPQNGTMEAEDDADSAYGESSYSETTSISSSIRRGIIENGRRYQTLREGEYWGPADEKQFDSMNLCHLVHLVLDCQEENPLFRSPVGENVQNILDLGTGEANWAIDVADRYPNATVRGVDLFPPPQEWAPPNCILEVDDIMKPWTWAHKFDLIHIRWMLGSCTPGGWRGLYKQAYDSLQPGGWIEQLEPSIDILCDDGSLPVDSKCAYWGPMFTKLGNKTARPLDNIHTMKESIAAAGFINVQEQTHKVPCNPWCRHPVLKEAGRLHLEELRTGIEGYAMFLLTKFGEPEPWSPESVHVYLAGVREELANKKYHTYTLAKRVWAQKPFDAVATAQTASK